MSKPGYASQGFWLRMLFMLIYWGLLNIALTLFGFLIIITTIVRFGSKSELTTLNYWAASMGEFIKQTVGFLCFTTEEKPYPFQPWPEDVRRED